MNDANSNAVTLATISDPTTNEGRRLLKILMASSGEFEAAAISGRRITPTDLASLTGASLEFVKSTVAGIAIGKCYERRPQENPWKEMYEKSMRILEGFRTGDIVFGTQEAADAGLIDISADTPQHVTDRNGMVVQMAGYFGTRGNRRGVV